MGYLHRSGPPTGLSFSPTFDGLRHRFAASPVRVTTSEDQKREEVLRPSWPSYGFDRIDAKNATILFSAGPFEANLRQSSRQGQQMPETAYYSHLARRPSVATLRKLIWIEEQLFHGWRCSECAWVFNASGPPSGHSLNEMMENYKQLRDKEFAAHTCAEHFRPKRVKV